MAGGLALCHDMLLLLASAAPAVAARSRCPSWPNLNDAFESRTFVEVCRYWMQLPHALAKGSLRKHDLRAYISEHYKRRARSVEFIEKQQIHYKVHAEHQPVHLVLQWSVTWNNAVSSVDSRTVLLLALHIALLLLDNSCSIYVQAVQSVTS
jgi:hypothetical protein